MTETKAFTIQSSRQRVSDPEQPKVKQEFVKQEFVDATDGRSNKYVEELNEKLGDVLDRVAKAMAKVEKEKEVELDARKRLQCEESIVKSPGAADDKAADACHRQSCNMYSDTWPPRKRVNY